MKWKLQWNIDGMQWDILRISLYEPSLPCKHYDCTEEMEYNTAMLFIHKNLIPYFDRNYKQIVRMHCIEGTYSLTFDDIRYVVGVHYPEELI